LESIPGLHKRLKIRALVALLSNGHTSWNALLLFIPLITYSVDIWFGSITLRNIIRIGQRPVLIQYSDVCIFMYICRVFTHVSRKALVVLEPVVTYILVCYICYVNKAIFLERNILSVYSRYVNQV
jgi:hypothetical protein